MIRLLSRSFKIIHPRIETNIFLCCGSGCCFLDINTAKFLFSAFFHMFSLSVLYFYDIYFFKFMKLERTFCHDFLIICDAKHLSADYSNRAPNTFFFVHIYSHSNKKSAILEGKKTETVPAKFPSAVKVSLVAFVPCSILTADCVKMFCDQKCAIRDGKEASFVASNFGDRR